MKRVRALIVKELTQIRRDPRLFGLLLIAPMIQLLVLGFAANTDVRDIRMAVRDNDHSVQSREYVRALSSSGYFKTRRLSGPERDDGELLVEGRTGLILVIPSGFGRRLTRGMPAQVQALVDGTDSNHAVHSLSYLQRATRRYTRPLLDGSARRLARRRNVRLPSVTIESRAWYNPDLRSRLYMVPGVMGVLLMVTTMIVTSMSLVKEREEGTMEQIIVTPLRPGELIAGKLLPFVVIGFAEVTLAVVVILGVFRVPMQGSLLLLYFFSGLFLLTTLGLGLFISTLVRTQQQAMMVASFFAMMPFVLLSGFIFPVENMPSGIAAIAHLIPLKYYLTSVRGIFLKGAGWAELWPQAVVLLVWGAAILYLAAVRFHKRLD